MPAPVSGMRRNSAVASTCSTTSSGSDMLWRRSSVRRHSTAQSSMVELETVISEGNDHLAIMEPRAAYSEFDPDGIPYVYTGMRVKIRGKYEYIDSAHYCVGHGAFGDVFKGYSHDRFHKAKVPVAIKRMAQVNVKPHELEAMKRVKNPFLVSLIDICHEHDDLNTYVIMELCHSDLEAYLQTSAPNGCLDPKEFDLVMKDLARGYYALYAESIVHRDIKPPNILLLLNREGTGIEVAKLTDFGVCRMLDDGDEGLCNVAGTFYYMAPEIGANVVTYCEYGHAVDMWSIGCVMYKCFTGELPFTEAQMCRLFLYSACQNYDAYDPPELPESTTEAQKDLLYSLLTIDRSQRLTPKEFYWKMTGKYPVEDGLPERKSTPEKTGGGNCSESAPAIVVASAEVGEVAAH
ncbi:unnamed protein product [Bursaphelenchus xylophilus]|uniref:(pine wood nematode) hypothetical protein n=1 Tax=Bursaphelenchus xylophilus TaxID=6326 RepID=A0A1I7RQM5_BURXY|nr:unnamed protein product [Bursaphelenchus xylophilus]CAG9104832.1 unnamed protein product [Bursaphelenchus xylophilus]